jgi:hypothetical protein
VHCLRVFQHPEHFGDNRRAHIVPSGASCWVTRRFLIVDLLLHRRFELLRRRLNGFAERKNRLGGSEE